MSASQSGEIVAACARGEMPPNVAVMHLIAISEAPADIDRLLVTFRPTVVGASAQRLSELAQDWDRNRDAWVLVKNILAAAGIATSEDDGRGLVAWQSAFDRAANVSADGACALYLLGRDDLAAQAASSIVEWLFAWGALRRAIRVLDLGCGSGRMTSALAAYAGRVTGVDISESMLSAARQRCSSLSNVELLKTNGEDLSQFEPESFELVLACDVFPYLVANQGELARRHFEEAARVLTAGGHFVILNYSYRNDPARDERDIELRAKLAGFDVIESGSQPFQHWDGRAFVLVKRCPSAAEPREGCR